MTKWIVLGVAVAAVVISTITGWPWTHTFSAHTWPGPFGWVATNTPGNLVAGFLQVGIAFAIGFGAHRVGLTEKVKNWATRDIKTEILHNRAEVAHAHELLHHVIHHSPDIPDVPHRVPAANQQER